jgi:ubiquinone/menaquinone biosynthesis C-methylase UbiE
MRHIKQDIGISSIQKITGKVFLKLYTYNAKLPVSQRIANWYHDAFSKFYDCLTPLVIPKYYETIDMLVREYIPEDSKVLDLCCGTGNIALAVAKKAKDVVGLDASEGMLSKARNKAEKQGIRNVKFIYGDVKVRQNFADEDFDVVTAGWSVPTNIPLFRYKNKDIMGEIYRILKRGGNVVLLEGLHEITNMYLSEEEYEELLSGVGFDFMEMKNINDLYAIVWAKK